MLHFRLSQVDREMFEAQGTGQSLVIGRGLDVLSSILATKDL